MGPVTIQVPKHIRDFVQKIAALEGTSPESWYQHWIQQEFDAIAADDFSALVDADKMKQVYCQ
jgi:hypothetical protein